MQQGRLEDSHGGVYEGQWLNNRREGQGTQTDRNGATYAGAAHTPAPPPTHPFLVLHIKHNRFTSYFHNRSPFYVLSIC